MTGFKVVLLLSSVLLASTAKGQSSAKASSVHVGQRLFVQRCMQCHSVNPGQVMLGPSLYGEMRLSPQRKTTAQVASQIKNGKGKMPPFKGVLTDDEVKDLVAYLGTL